MESQKRAALLALKGSAISDVDVRDIEDELISKGVLSVADKERIHAAKSTGQQTNTLVDIIVERNRPHSFEIFLDSIKAPYEHVWQKLVEAKSSPQTALNSDQCEAIFIEGGIPVLPQGNVELEFVVQLKDHLVKLSQRRDGGWIVIWGQAGSGKSIMAAQAVRGFCSSQRRIAAYFYNKVFWVHIGKLSNNDKERDAQLLLKMQNFCKRLDSSSRFQPPVDLEAARDMLRSTLIKNYPICLIVLDDVWDPMVLKFFNVQARILITSRSSDILSRVQRGEHGRTETIHVDRGFTESSSISLLNQMVPQEGERPNSEKTSCFKRIHEGCNGSPFVVSIFGSLLSQSSMSRFEYFFKKYKNTAFSSDNVEAGDYHYENISDAIMVSVEDLQEDDKSLYLRLSIFMSNSLLSPAFLSAYCWTDLDEEEARETLEKFVRRSIATEEKIKADMQTFTLHDIIVSGLRSKFQKETAQYNSEFVKNVLQSRDDCSSWHDMEDDCNYLAENFVYHLVSDSDVPIDDKKDLLLDFDFLSWLCCSIGPDSLAFCYRFALKALKLGDTWQEMHKFIRLPVFRIQSLGLAGGQSTSTSSLVQLALSFAEGDSLQQHVKEWVFQHEHSACFFHWMNKAQTEEQIMDTLELGCNVTSYTLNDELTHVAVVSDCSVVIKDLNSRSTLYRRQDKEFDNDPVVTAFFGSDKESIWLLTASRLIRYRLPEFALETNSLMSPALQGHNKRYTMLFPIERPRTRTYSSEKEEERAPAQLVWQDEKRPEDEFTAMCFTDDQKLIVGSQNGRIYELTVTSTFINCCYDYQIDMQATDELCVRHIASRDSSIAVSGPDYCVYVYETRPNDNVTSSSVRKYTGFQELREPPIQSVLGVLGQFKWIISISKHEIRLWDSFTLDTLLTEQCQNYTEFTSLALSKDGAHLAVSTSRAHIYLYRVATDASVIGSGATLELVDELNGTGTRSRCLTFQSKSLFSLSEVSSESVLTKWIVRVTSSSPCFQRKVNRQSSIFFGNECCTLRLRTVYDAVFTPNNRMVMACQSVRRSLLILESTENGNLRHIGKYKGEGFQLGKVSAVCMAAGGKSAVYALPNGVVKATEAEDGSWQFTYKVEPIWIRDLVMLPSNRGFIGSNRWNQLVVYDANFQRVKTESIFHTHLLPLRMPQAIDSHKEARAVVLTESDWNFVTESLDIIANRSIAEVIQEDATFLVSFDVSDDGRFGAGGLSNGRMVLWNITTGEAIVVNSRSVQPLRCVKFAPRSHLLAGAYDDGRFSLWHLPTMEVRNIQTLLDCHPVPTTLQATGADCVSESSVSLAWSVNFGFVSDGNTRYRLVMACDRCVWILCCMTDQDFIKHDQLDPARISLVPLYSRQGVNKTVVLGLDGEDLLYVDNSHTVFWLRSMNSLHGQRRCSAP
ncbi:hypothetical protein BOX15_Mlig028976g2 [Macrostomum lignano]|uniref:CARD domain-containing protein n=1 Tax=Macrostomum lignano TaxID=282301 RepID=A0A267FRB5_9PLAT|nr:hypothetical protein BOX15_Mlig028976g2 [Macrostomum lignano]